MVFITLAVYRKVFSTVNLGIRIAVYLVTFLEVLKNEKEKLYLRRLSIIGFKKRTGEASVSSISNSDQTRCRTWQDSCHRHTWLLAAAHTEG